MSMRLERNAVRISRACFTSFLVQERVHLRPVFTLPEPLDSNKGHAHD
jgi:hypothetical protein